MIHPDRRIAELRKLAEKVSELSRSPENLTARRLWISHNSLEKTRSPVYVRINCWPELIPEDEIVFKEGVLRSVELELRQRLYNWSLGYDFVMDPFISISAVWAGASVDELWELPVSPRLSTHEKGAWGFNPPLKEYDDIEKLRKPSYRIDDRSTEESREIVYEAVGDLLDIHIDYGGPIGISASLGVTATKLRGFEQLMLDVIDNPEWVHKLMNLLMEGHLEYMRQMEEQGKITPNHERWPFYHQPLCSDYNPNSVRLKDCWGWGESQEFDQFSPAMFDEFLLRYQLPIFELTTLNNFGCCENLNRKYPLLKTLPGLRRVSVSP